MLIFRKKIEDIPSRKVQQFERYAYSWKNSVRMNRKVYWNKMVNAYCIKQ